MQTPLLFEKESYQIIGACFEVYRGLKATRSRLGLLVNFGHYQKTQVERIIAERGRYAHDQ